MTKIFLSTYALGLRTVKWIPGTFSILPSSVTSSAPSDSASATNAAEPPEAEAEAEVVWLTFRVRN
jgi:hypothetical protein